MAEQLEYTQTRSQEIKNRLESLKSKSSLTLGLVKLIPLTSILVFVVIAGGYFLSAEFRNPYLVAVAVLYLLVGLVFLVYPFGRETQTEVEALEAERELLSLALSSIELRSEKLFKAHEVELKKYYNQTLKQNRLIFLAGIMCMLIGSSVVVVTLYYSISSLRDPNPVVSIFISSLGVISGILVNFVSVVFLKMFSESMKSLNLFHEKLVSTNRLYFKNFLLTKISDGVLRDKTTADIILGMDK